MRILHAYCLNYNIGDYALGIGVKHLLRQIFPVDLIAEVNIQGQVFDDYFIDVVNKNYDLLVLGGGGLIHGAHWPNGWFWLIKEENIKKLQIPFVVFGVGNNYFDDEPQLPDRGVSHLRETYQRAAHFSVRNDGSAGRLRDQTGINADVIADPGFFLPVSTYRHAAMEQPYIVVQLADDKPKYRYRDGCRAGFVEQMQRTVRLLAEKYHVCFAPHVLADVGLCKEVMGDFANTSIMDFGKFAFDGSDRFLSIYQEAEFVLAMRGHGQIVPLGFGVPVIALHNHPKHKGLLDDFGLGRFVVDVRTPDLSATILNAIPEVLDERERIAGNVRRRLDYLHGQLKYFLSFLDF